MCASRFQGHVPVGRTHGRCSCSHPIGMGGKHRTCRASRLHMPRTRVRPARKDATAQGLQPAMSGATLKLHGSGRNGHAASQARPVSRPAGADRDGRKSSERRPSPGLPFLPWPNRAMIGASRRLYCFFRPAMLEDSANPNGIEHDAHTFRGANKSVLAAWLNQLPAH
jgi:hypothetical protein